MVVSALGLPRTIPTLASRAGSYHEQQPIEALRRHFSHAWANRISQHHRGTLAVVPDGCVDITWNDGCLAVVGPDTVAANPKLTPGSTVLGVRFRAGAAVNWLGLPMTEIVGRQVELAAFWGARALDIAARLGDIPTDQSRLVLLQHLLAGEVSRFDGPPAEAAQIFAFLRTGTDAPEARCAALLKRLDMSERTLRRRSRDLFGYGPKMLDRILRLQRFQALVIRTDDTNLAGLALQAGYADQAHLSREVQSLCAMTARAFVDQLTADAGRFVQDRAASLG